MSVEYQIGVVVGWFIGWAIFGCGLVSLIIRAFGLFGRK